MYRRFSRVITAADSYALVTLDDLKADLNITVDTDDAYLTRAVEQASAAASAYCNRVFQVETVEDTFVIVGSTPHLMLSRAPVVSVATVEQGGRSLADGDDYRLDAKSGVIYPTYGRWLSADVVVTYDAGFDPIPMDLQGAATSMVKALQFNRTRDPLLRSENILSGLYAYTLFDASSVAAGTAQQVASTLDAYKAVRL